MVPVDTRRPRDLLRPGNHVSSFFVPLPVAAEATAARHAAVVRAAAAHKAAHEAQAGEDVIALTGWIPPAMHGALARAVFTSRLFTVTVTNVAGPQTPLSAFGACLRRAIPLVPLASGHAVGVAVLSYDGTVCFSVQADRAAVPEVELVAEGIAAELQALRALADARSAPAVS